MRIIILLLGVFFCSCLSVRSQTYQFTHSNAPYTELQGGTPFLTGFIDSINLGFNLNLAGTTNNRILIMQHGRLTTGTYFGTSKWFEPLGADVSQGQNSYHASGTPGQRVVKIQFKNAKFSHDFTMQDYINFQVWIYESNQSLEVRFGSSVTNNMFEDYYPGNGGPGIGFPNLTLTGNPSSPSTSTVQTTYLTGTPSSGKVYTFTPAPNTVAAYIGGNRSFSVHPNPTDKWLHLNIGVKTLGYVVVSDYSGRVVYESTSLMDGNLLDVSCLSPGIYFLSANNLPPVKFVRR